MNKKCSASSERACSNCLAPNGSQKASKLSACSRCGLVFYCSKDCQRAHWKANHKQHCIAKTDRKPQQQGQAESTQNAISEHADKECSICLEQISNASTCSLPCAHVFHSSCVEGLRKFGVEQACPLCRAPLPEGPEKLNESAARRFMIYELLVDHGKASWASLPTAAREQVRVALSEWRAAAGQGHVLAQYNLGNLYHLGKGVAKNEATAAQWYKKAADQGYAMAQYCLGNVYLHGGGVARDPVEAAKWFQKAAEQGSAEAQGGLGTMYSEGLGVKQSYAKAIEWWKKAAVQGNVHSQYDLGVNHSAGRGVAKDMLEAVKWFSMAAQQGYAKAQYNMGCACMDGVGVLPNPLEAVNWWRKAADQGHDQAQFVLGHLHSKGKVVEKSENEAKRWWRKAARQGHMQALAQLRNC